MDLELGGLLTAPVAVGIAHKPDVVSDRTNNDPKQYLSSGTLSARCSFEKRASWGRDACSYSDVLHHGDAMMRRLRNYTNCTGSGRTVAYI